MYVLLQDNVEQLMILTIQFLINNVLNKTVYVSQIENNTANWTIIIGSYILIIVDVINTHLGHIENHIY